MDAAENEKKRQETIDETYKAAALQELAAPAYQGGSLSLITFIISLYNDKSKKKFSDFCKCWSHLGLFYIFCTQYI